MVSVNVIVSCIQLSAPSPQPVSAADKRTPLSYHLVYPLTQMMGLHHCVDDTQMIMHVTMTLTGLEHCKLLLLSQG